MPPETPGLAFDPALKPDPLAVQVVTARAKQLADGPKPEWLFLCSVTNGLLTYQTDPNTKVVLLFMTPFAAADYANTTKTAAQIRQIKFDAVPESANKWLAAGARGLALNRCPRCPVTLCTPLQAVANRKIFELLWAARRAAQFYFGQRTVQQYLTAKEPSARRASLELIRDHIDGGVPYVYELLAFFARSERDEPARNAALEELKKFGPQFANWEATWGSASTDVWVRAMVGAHIGLCQAFGMEFKTPAKA